MGASSPDCFQAKGDHVRAQGTVAKKADVADRQWAMNAGCAQDCDHGKPNHFTIANEEFRIRCNCNMKRGRNMSRAKACVTEDGKQ